MLTHYFLFIYSLSAHLLSVNTEGFQNNKLARVMQKGPLWID